MGPGEASVALLDHFAEVEDPRTRRSQTNGQKAIHVVSAFAHGLGVTLGQVKTDEKSNEIMAITELLDALLPKGCLVTIDAIGCQKAIAAQIIRQESDSPCWSRTTSPAWPRRSKACSTPPKKSATKGVSHSRAE